MDIAIAIIQTIGVFIAATYGIFVVIAVVNSIKYIHFYRKYIFFSELEWR